MTANAFTLPEQLSRLKEYPNWVGFKKVPDRKLADGTQHYSKRPIDPVHTKKGRPAYAKSNDPKTWATYDQALAAWNAFPDLIDGLGFQFGGTPFCGVDLDNVIDNTGRLSDEAKDVIQTLESYTELSPSGRGFHVLLEASCPAGKRRKGFIEMYDTGRYFTISGKPYKPCPIRADQTASERLKTIHARYLAHDPDEKKQQFLTWADVAPDPQHRGHQPRTDSKAFSDNERLLELEKSDKGRRLLALFNGDMTAYNGDHSAADQALMNGLLWYCWHDTAQADRLFRRSALMRPKWDDIHDPANGLTYGQMTLNSALASVRRRQDREFQPSSSVGLDSYSKTAQESPMTAKTENGEYLPVSGTNGLTSPATSPQVKEEVTTQEICWNKLKKFVQESQTAGRMNEFMEHIHTSKERGEIDTGYKNLNAVLDGGLYPGLYAIGAISSLGKTTFALQMADHIAANGTPVVIISMEMGRDELISKSISRLTRLEAPNHGNLALAKTARGITNGRRWDGYTDASGKVWPPYSRDELDLLDVCMTEYERTTAQNLFIFEGNTEMTHKRIRDIVQAFTEVYGRSPVVLVDYIQILRPADPKLTDKQSVDQSVLALKNISRDFECPVIAISSLNRANYKTAIDFEAFKESGALEYGSDVMIGLQLEGAGDKDFNALEEKARDPRRIELKILKNRNGRIPGEPLKFRFYPAFNLFEEVR